MHLAAKAWPLLSAACDEHTVLCAGILAGMKTVRYFGSRNYDWSGLSEQKTVIGKAKRSILQFSPHTWDDFDWRLTSSPLRCIQCLFPIVLILLMEVRFAIHPPAKQRLWHTCFPQAAALALLVSTSRAWPGTAAQNLDEGSVCFCFEQDTLSLHAVVGWLLWDISHRGCFPSEMCYRT